MNMDTQIYQNGITSKYNYIDKYNCAQYYWVISRSQLNLILKSVNRVPEKATFTFRIRELMPY